MPDPARAVPSVGPLRLRLLTLLALMAYGLVAMTICLPSTQEWGTRFGARASTVQLTFSGFVLTYGALQLAYGPLSDRHGRRGLLLLGLAVASLASVAAALAPTIEWLIAARVLQGAGCAACMVLGRAAVQDLYAGPERTRAMAYVGMTMGLCPPLATVLGGQLHARFGWQANFVLLAALGAALAVAGARGMPSGRGDAAPAGEPGATGGLRAIMRGYGRLVREPVFVLNVWVLALTSGAFYAYLGGAPLVLGRYGVGPAAVGFYIMVPPLSYIVGNLLTSRLVRRVGELRLAMAGQAVTLVGIGLMLACALAGWRSPLSFVLPLALLGIGHGLLIPPTLAATIGLLPTLAGAAAAIAGVMQQCFGALGGYLVGWVPHDGPIGVGVLMLVFALGSSGAQLALQRRGPGPSRRSG